MKRPSGISVLALLLLLSGVFHAVYSVMLYSHPNIGTNFTTAYLKQMLPVDGIDATGILLMSMAVAVASLAIGAGLWFLQELARWGLLLVTGIPLGRGLIGAVAYVAENPSRFGRYFGEAFWLPTIVLGAIVAYLLQPDVQLAFGARKGYYDEYSPREVEAGEYGLKNPAERD